MHQRGALARTTSMDATVESFRVKRCFHIFCQHAVQLCTDLCKGGPQGSRLMPACLNQIFEVMVCLPRKVWARIAVHDASEQEQHVDHEEVIAVAEKLPC